MPVYWPIVLQEAIPARNVIFMGAYLFSAPASRAGHRRQKQISRWHFRGAVFALVKTAPRIFSLEPLLHAAGMAKKRVFLANDAFHPRLKNGCEIF